MTTENALTVKVSKNTLTTLKWIARGAAHGKNANPKLTPLHVGENYIEATDGFEMRRVYNVDINPSPKPGPYNAQFTGSLVTLTPTTTYYPDLDKILSVSGWQEIPLSNFCVIAKTINDPTVPGISILNIFLYQYGNTTHRRLHITNEDKTVIKICVLAE